MCPVPDCASAYLISGAFFFTLNRGWGPARLATCWHRCSLKANFARQPHSSLQGHILAPSRWTLPVREHGFKAGTRQTSGKRRRQQQRRLEPRVPLGQPRAHGWQSPGARGKRVRQRRQLHGDVQEEDGGGEEEKGDAGNGWRDESHRTRTGICGKEAASRDELCKGFGCKMR